MYPLFRARGPKMRQNETFHMFTPSATGLAPYHIPEKAAEEPIFLCGGVVCLRVPSLSEWAHH